MMVSPAGSVGFAQGERVDDPFGETGLGAVRWGDGKGLLDGLLESSAREEGLRSDGVLAQRERIDSDAAARSVWNGQATVF